MRVVKAPHQWEPEENDSTVIFLAGSIEMGKAENWQDEIIEELKDIEGIIILNPRRDDWDSSWVQSIDNPQFKEQVEWKLKGMEQSHIVIMCFDPNTKSPITLLELGLIANRKPFFGGERIVYCPEGYWRKGDVDIVCERYGVDVAKSREELMSMIREKIAYYVITYCHGKLSLNLNLTDINLFKKVIMQYAKTLRSLEKPGDIKSLNPNP